MQPITCTQKRLPSDLWIKAAKTAIAINPTNDPGNGIAKARGVPLSPEHLAVITAKLWPASGVNLSVSFLDNPTASLRSRLIQHMNAWNKTANVTFVETGGTGQVRIARSQNSGYWSYLGTDILHIPQNQPTMNLEAFTDNTPESEFVRVVRHETGHTLGMPHEHLRRELVDLIDVQKAIAYFESTQGWSEEDVRAQVLTPIEESSIRATPHADPLSIMCYEIPGSITKSGQPIIGGMNIDDGDYAFIATIYPKGGTPPPPPVVASHHLFSLIFARPVPPRGRVSFITPVLIPAGKVDVSIADSASAPHQPEAVFVPIVVPPILQGENDV